VDAAVVGAMVWTRERAVKHKNRLQAAGFRLQASGCRLQASGFRLQGVQTTGLSGSRPYTACSL
jgi:hypothetical protein